MIFKINALVLMLTALFIIIVSASDIKFFSVETIGELTLKMKRVEEIRSKPKNEADVPEGSTFIKGTYYLDTYTLESKSNQEIWSKTVTYSAILAKSMSLKIDVHA